MSTEALPYRLKVRVGRSEFEAEGPEAVVREQFEMFMSVALCDPRVENEETSTTATVAHIVEPAQGDREPDTAFEWSRAYREHENFVSLNLVPETDAVNADSLLLLIYGCQKILEQDAVSSVTLMQAARQSGLRIDRIDRNIPASHSRFVIKGGSGKGSRYALNNRGLAYAQELLERMFE